MARPGLRNHPKFKRLLAMLGIPEPHLYGLLQMLWDAAYEFGEDIGDAIDVEVVAGWTGTPGTFCKALAECAGADRHGFIEPIPGAPGRWRVHDLYDHAPTYVQKRMEREAERKLRGQTISDARRNAAMARHHGSKLEQTDANGNHLQPLDANGNHLQPLDANERTPSPSPSPSPSPINPLTPKGDQEGEQAPPKRKRMSKAERLLGYREDVVAMLNRLMDRWSSQRADGSKVDNDIVDAASNVERILAEYAGITLDLLEQAAGEWLDEAKAYPNAIQFWFGRGKNGAEPPWRRNVRAILTRKASA